VSSALRAAGSADIDELMSWFSTEEATRLWAGPKFRYPFTHSTFIDDCRWRDFDSYCLLEAGDIVAFGQIGTRYQRCHFARLVVSPQKRRQGFGKQLLSKLMTEASARYAIDQFGLFVYRHNTAALACYQSLGYEIADYPDDAPMRDECFYLVC